MTRAFENKVIRDLYVETRKYIYVYEWDPVDGYRIQRIEPAKLSTNNWQIVKVMYK